ncbi:MAG: nitroreductase family protein [Candidatus Poribacteria bacterium]
MGSSKSRHSVCRSINQNMLLKAHDLGLGSLWICDVLFVEEAIRNKLEISLPLIAAVAFGYPDESPVREPRLSVDDLTIWY